MSNLHRRLLVILAVFAMIVAACASDDDEDGGSAETDDPPADESEPDETDEPDEDVDSDEPDETDEPDEDTELEDTELTDSFRGVTADTIKIGHAAIDFDTLNNDFGLDLAFQDFRPQMDAIVAWYNEQGGINGRQIEVVHELFVPVGPVTAEAACTVLTEDEQVFAVLNGFSGPGAENVNTCITELNETILVGGVPTADQAEAAEGRWVSEEMALARRNAAVVTLLEDAELLEELGTVMVIGSSPDDEGVVNELVSSLEDAGVDVAFGAFNTAVGDETATVAEVQVFVERGRSDGVETVFKVGEGEFINIELFRQAPELTYVLTNGDRITDWSSIPPEGLQEGTRVLTSTGGPDPVDNPEVMECVEVVEEATGVEVVATENLPEGDPNYWSGTLGACRRMAVFVQIATAAGPDLTNDSWAAALDTVEDFSVPGFEFASISSDKTDVRDVLYLAEYNLAELSFDELTDAVDVAE